MLQKMNFSKSEFKKLVMMCYWGQWLRNSFIALDDQFYDQECDNLLDYLCEFAEENGMGDYITEAGGKKSWSSQLDNLCLPYAQIYDTWAIIDYLSEKMALREFLDKYSRYPEDGEDDDLIISMREERMHKIQEKWLDEINVHVY